MNRARASFIAIPLLLLPTLVVAHGVRLEVTTYEEAIVGRASFADGTAVAEAPVELRGVSAAQSRSLARTRTDVQGRFAFPVPTDAGDYRLIVDDGLGHRGELTLTRSADAPSSTAEPSILSTTVQHSHRHWRDWASGLGYLLGVFGLAAWWLGRRKARERDGV